MSITFNEERNEFIFRKEWKEKQYEVIPSLKDLYGLKEGIDGVYELALNGYSYDKRYGDMNDIIILLKAVTKQINKQKAVFPKDEIPEEPKYIWKE